MPKKKSKKPTRKKKPRSLKKRASTKSKKQADVIPFPALHSIENVLSSFGGTGFSETHTSADEAQFIMYDAWEAPTRKQAVALAKKALKISPDCTDAYNLLAEQTAKNRKEALELYRQGMEAGERALGEQIFKDDVGHFWGLMETRPYMRARAGLALELWEAGKHQEAIEHYWELLRLNPGDNQGIRYILLSHLIKLSRYEEADKLYRKFEDDDMADWLYSRVLLDFRKHGDSPVAIKSLKLAREENPHVPSLLTGRKKMPSRLPAYHGFGDFDEAVLYVHYNLKLWKNTSGALEWLLENE